MAKKRHVPPSRRRYEESNPTVSARVPRALFDQLQMLRRESGKNIADVLKEALGAQGPSVKQSYQLGYKEGLHDAEKRCRVDYRCSICGGTITLSTDKEKQAAARFMKEHNWAHKRCRE